MLIFALLLKSVNKMSVIQTIRNKYIGIMIGAIVLALVGFLVMDSVQNNTSNIFSSKDNTMGNVNGTAIAPTEYSDAEKLAVDNAKSKDPKISSDELDKVRDQAWEQLINDKLMTSEYEKLGITVGKKELQEMLTGQYADPFIRQQFTDPATGMFNPANVKSYIEQLSSGKDKKAESAREQWSGIEKSLITQRLQQKYGTLISMGSYTPKAIMDVTFGQRSNSAAINYVMVPYTAITDADIKITDDDIKAHEAKYPDMFTLREELRNVDYVSFDITPTADDSAKSIGVINRILPEFGAATNQEEFIGKNGDEPFDNKFHKSGDFESPRVDSSSNAPVGAVVGPYFEDGAFKVSKILAKASLPDSIRASHIFIAFTQTLKEEDADVRADSVMKVLNAGGSLEQMAASYSDDEQSKSKGGDMGYFLKGTNRVPKEYEDYALTAPKGAIKKIKTNNGIFLVKITDQKGYHNNAKIATLVKRLQRSDATVNAVFSKVTAFASTIKTKADFEAAVKKQGLTKLVAENMMGTQRNIQGLGNAREVVNFAYRSELNSVSNILNLNGEKYVVACLTAINPKGLAPVNLVRQSVEADLRRNKKAAKIAEMYKGSATSLDAIAAKVSNGATVKTCDTVTVGFATGDITNEARVLGAALNKANVNKVSSAIAGNMGVYYIFVKSINNTGTKPSPEAYNQEGSMMTNQLMQNLGRALPEILKRKAKVVDNRSKFM
jgi:peptidyl-prolyl cis-trans isomerase D